MSIKNKCQICNDENYITFMIWGNKKKYHLCKFHYYKFVYEYKNTAIQHFINLNRELYFKEQKTLNKND